MCNHPYVRYGVSFAVGLIIGAGFFSLLHSLDDTSSFIEVRKRGDYSFISPLVECDVNLITQGSNLNSLQDAVEDFIKWKVDLEEITHASVYFRDLNNGPWFGINENDRFSPSSLIKVPLMIAYFKETERDPALLSQRVLISEKSDGEMEQNYLPEVSLTKGERVTIEELINHMIIYSDNYAYDLLLNHIDSTLVFSVYSDFDINMKLANQTDPYGNIISVKDYASFFRILYNSSYLDNTMSERTLSILSKSTFKKGIVAGVPSKVTVAHKFGERNYELKGEKQLHDCGIVYVPNRPYLICIMTRGKEFSKLEKTIAGISKIVYEGVTK